MSGWCEEIKNRDKKKTYTEERTELKDMKVNNKWKTWKTRNWEKKWKIFERKINNEGKQEKYKDMHKEVEETKIEIWIIEDKKKTWEKESNIDDRDRLTNERS